MKKTILAFIVLLIVSLACGSSSPQVKTADDYVGEFGGNPDVYKRILSLNDCALLQDEFNQAEANTKLQAPGTEQYKWSLGYMTAADDRMKALNCYEGSFNAPVVGATDNLSPTALFTATIFFLPTLTKPVLSTPITIPGTADTPTPIVTFVLPTQPTSLGAVCSCSADTLNCSDFSDQDSAQACMDYCVAQGAGDIHNLDGDANGLACESN